MSLSFGNYIKLFAVNWFVKQLNNSDPRRYPCETPLIGKPFQNLINELNQIT